MTPLEISKMRLISQKVAEPEFNTAKEIVSWMGAIQAQDFAMSKWAIGIRLCDPSDQMIESAIDKGEIIRTHLLRPTWHFVASDDLYWMLKLSAPKLKSSMKSRNRELEATSAAPLPRARWCRWHARPWPPAPPCRSRYEVRAPLPASASAASIRGCAAHWRGCRPRNCR